MGTCGKNGNKFRKNAMKKNICYKSTEQRTFNGLSRLFNFVLHVTSVTSLLDWNDAGYDKTSARI